MFCLLLTASKTCRVHTRKIRARLCYQPSTSPYHFLPLFWFLSPQATSVSGVLPLRLGALYIASWLKVLWGKKKENLRLIHVGEAAVGQHGLSGDAAEGKHGEPAVIS